MNPANAVSVAIPTYNRLWALPRSVAQFYDDPLVGEILVVNDGSIDGTREWLEQEAVKHPALRPIHHPRNRGVAAARNTVIDAARCDYILFWDDDMLLQPAGGLKILLSELQRYQGDMIAPASMATEGQPPPDVPSPSEATGNLLKSSLLLNRWTVMTRGLALDKLPRQTFQSPLLNALTLQRRDVYRDLRYSSDLAPTYFREETDVHLALAERGCRLLACPFVYALDLRRPASSPDGGCHSHGTMLRYDLIACRNNWRVLRRRRRAIRSELGIRMPIALLQAIFVCERLLYRLPRKLAGHVLRKMGLRR
jgi:glycosyltransferase involved in cell wall biosynthesis